MYRSLSRWSLSARIRGWAFSLGNASPAKPRAGRGEAVRSPKSVGLYGFDARQRIGGSSRRCGFHWSCTNSRLSDLRGVIHSERTQVAKGAAVLGCAGAPKISGKAAGSGKARFKFVSAKGAANWRIWGG